MKLRLTMELGSRIAVLLILLVGAEQKASAYTDPGSGALILQVVAAAFVGGLYYFRNLLARIRGKRQ
jgi:hypothetical protein